MTAKRKYVRGSVGERLDAHSEQAPNGCRLWTGTKNSKGYGQLTIAGRRAYAHRLAYESVNGPIPSGLFVMHVCDTPACVNPAHLGLGTPAQNMADKVGKGRQQAGAQVWNATLNAEQVAAIKHDQRRQREIAKDYGVSRATINDIKCGRTWRTATGARHEG